jgi:hypothetical protein
MLCAGAQQFNDWSAAYRMLCLHRYYRKWFSDSTMMSRWW